MNVASLELCKELDCDILVGNHGARGYCPKHYKRLMRTGKPSEAYPARTHGKTHTSEYHVWSAMIQRCTNPNNPQYKWYGARGIKVHKPWLKFENFYADVGDKPSPELEIDRIDNERGYYPSNVKWSTRKEQMNNMRRNKNYASR